MAHLNYLGGLHKEFGHVKVMGDEDAHYEPAIYIINETAPRFKDQSFIIPLSCMWKYCEPWWTMSADEMDMQEMIETTKQVLTEKHIILAGFGGLITQEKMHDVNVKLAALAFSYALNKSNHILRQTGFSLAICMQMFDIEPTPQAAAQLLLFIQDGLDQLKNMPLHIPEKEWVIGEAKLSDGGVPIGKQPMTLSESDLYADSDNGTRH